MLMVSLTGLAYLIFLERYMFAALLAPVCIYFLVLNFRSQMRAYREIEEFAEAASYRDFTRFFPLKNVNTELYPLRSAFNDINAVFKKISGDRETQYQYLQHILEIVDTALLSYDVKSGKVMWMNDAFKDLFGIPHLHHFQALGKRNPDIYEKTIHLKPGEQTLVTSRTAKGNIKLMLFARQFQTAEGNYQLLVFQNVNEAIDEAESKAWQKLLSVLTHEIMNSIAPISSLADTLKSRLEGMGDSEAIADVRLGAETIRRRSEGLLKFAGTYRSLNKIARPNLSSVKAADLFENLYVLMEPTLIQKNIELDIVLKDTQLQFQIDVSLIEQVLINLLLNAIEAVRDTEHPQIILSAQAQGGKFLIKVTDNGCGMSSEMIDNIFIPFFTTRKSGSGVGLTLSKQIMLLHNGNILVSSEAGKGTVFTLQF